GRAGAGLDDRVGICGQGRGSNRDRVAIDRLAGVVLADIQKTRRADRVGVDGCAVEGGEVRALAGAARDRVLGVAGLAHARAPFPPLLRFQASVMAATLGLSAEVWPAPCWPMAARSSRLKVSCVPAPKP